MKLPVISVNVGMPQILGVYQREQVLSGIAKVSVSAASIFVGETDIEGDRQADLSVHGGKDKAVYCYPSDHWPWWERDNGFACRPGAFGENLTIEGADEDAVAIGDRFRWGEAILEVSQPRAPCFKFALYSRRPDAPSLMTVSGRSGWYFRVIREGRAPVALGVLEREFQSGSASVREAFQAALDPRVGHDVMRRVHDANALAESWRKAVSRRLGG